jgi:hypothetical protein
MRVRKSLTKRFIQCVNVKISSGYVSENLYVFHYIHLIKDFDINQDECLRSIASP